MGKHDTQIKELFNQGMGGRLISYELDVNLGTISKRMKALGLVSGKKNQNQVSCASLNVKFTQDKEKLRFAAEHYARYLFLMSGYEILNPDYFDTKPYDFQFELGGVFKKVQIKTSYHKKGNGFSFSLTKSRHNSSSTNKKLYFKGEIDYFFLHSINGRSWLVPFEQVDGKTSITPEVSLPNFEIRNINE